MIVDQAEEDVEMSQDPFLEAGISIPESMPYQPKDVVKQNVEKAKDSKDSIQNVDKKEDIKISIAPPSDEKVENLNSTPV